MEQHLEALAKANKHRVMKRKIRDDVRDGIVLVQDLLYDPPEVMLNVAVSYFLLSKRGWAQTRTETILRRAGCTDQTKVGKLTERQKSLLMETISSMGKPLVHSPCPGCGGKKYYDSKLCVRCSNKSRARR